MYNPSRDLRIRTIINKIRDWRQLKERFFITLWNGFGWSVGIRPAKYEGEDYLIARKIVTGEAFLINSVSDLEKVQNMPLIVKQELVEIIRNCYENADVYQAAEVQMEC